MASRQQKGTTRKVKPIWIYCIVSGSGISCAICKSAPWPCHITTPASHHSVFTGRVILQLPPAPQFTREQPVWHECGFAATALTFFLCHFPLNLDEIRLGQSRWTLSRPLIFTGHAPAFIQHCRRTSVGHDCAQKVRWTCVLTRRPLRNALSKQLCPFHSSHRRCRRDKLSIFGTMSERCELSWRLSAGILKSRNNKTVKSQVHTSYTASAYTSIYSKHCDDPTPF